MEPELLCGADGWGGLSGLDAGAEYPPCGCSPPNSEVPPLRLSSIFMVSAMISVV